MIDKKIHCARLQGPSPGKKMNSNDVIPLITTFSSNFDTKNITTNIRSLLSNENHGKLRSTVQNIKVVSAYKQPKNLKKLLIKAKFRDKSNSESTLPPTPSLPPGLYANCKDKRCNLCSLGYIQPCTAFKCSNGKIWEIRSVITCNTINVVYYICCLMCNVDTYTGKTWQKLRGRTNDHISKCRGGTGDNKLDRHVYSCGIKNKCLAPPYFKVYAFMALSSREKLLTYEKYFQRNGYDTLNR